MSIERLDIRNVRIIGSASINPARGVNLLYGRNASGKTSILEAIHLLALGRSFRTHHISRVVRKGEQSLILFSRLAQGGGEVTSVGVERGDKIARMRVNGVTVHSTADLARQLPVILINPDIHAVIEQGPGNRRQLLDWGLFHVEHEFLPVWRRFTKALRQRNAGLKRGIPGGQLSIWHGEMAESAALIDSLRRSYVEMLLPHARKIVATLLPGASLTTRYERGWRGNESYQQYLERSTEGDRQCGYTRHGPHRADIGIELDGTPARERVSRGEQKMLATALRLAQAELLRERTGVECVLLVDDLAAELDRERRRVLLELLARTGCQVFITATEPDSITEDATWIDSMFHVEHGVIKEVV